MLASLIVAFSMYSRLPMPQIKWTEKSMRYAMLFFPCVGIVIGGTELLCFWGLSVLDAGEGLRAAAVTALPILITGGIHLDGFIDTIDARRSYKSREEKLEILKDPHIGAFALIYGALYLLLFFGGASELKGELLPVFALSFCLSRILSGISVVTFPKAKETGTLQAFAKTQNRRVLWGLLTELLLCAVLLVWLSSVYGALVLLAGLLCFLYYYRMSSNVFGGTTGDLAGYFLSLAELVMLWVLVMGKLIMAWYHW